MTSKTISIYSKRIRAIVLFFFMLEEKFVTIEFWTWYLVLKLIFWCQMNHHSSAISIINLWWFIGYEIVWKITLVKLLLFFKKLIFLSVFESHEKNIKVVILNMYVVDKSPDPHLRPPHFLLTFAILFWALAMAI